MAKILGWLSEPDATASGSKPWASEVLIESFNPEPQATACQETVTCGSGSNKTPHFAA